MHFYSPHLFFPVFVFLFANEFFSIAHLLGDPGERKQGNHLLEDRVHLSVPLPMGLFLLEYLPTLLLFLLFFSLFFFLLFF